MIVRAYDCLTAFSVFATNYKQNIATRMLVECPNG